MKTCKTIFILFFKMWVLEWCNRKQSKFFLFNVLFCSTCFLIYRQSCLYCHYACRLGHCPAYKSCCHGNNITSCFWGHGNGANKYCCWGRKELTHLSLFWIFLIIKFSRSHLLRLKPKTLTFWSYLLVLVVKWIIVLIVLCCLQLKQS